MAHGYPKTSSQQTRRGNFPARYSYNSTARPKPANTNRPPSNIPSPANDNVPAFARKRVTRSVASMLGKTLPALAAAVTAYELLSDIRATPLFASGEPESSGFDHKGWTFVRNAWYKGTAMPEGIFNVFNHNSAHPSYYRQFSAGGRPYSQLGISTAAQDLHRMEIWYWYGYPVYNTRSIWHKDAGQVVTGYPQTVTNPAKAGFTISPAVPSLVPSIFPEMMPVPLPAALPQIVPLPTSVPQYVTSLDPHTVPLPSTLPAPAPAPLPARPPRHKRRPPNRRERERKVHARNGLGSAVEAAIGATTEVLDFINAAYYSLPPSARCGCSTPQCKAKCVIDNWDKVSIVDLVKNLALNEVGDRIGAKVGKVRAKQKRRLYNQTGLSGTQSDSFFNYNLVF